jgi:signal transduction histidine kinase/ligand-binding sensor domain-containing protein
MRRLAFGILLAWCRCSSAESPSLDIGQYKHTAWTIRDGALDGRINWFAQTADGYLWLGGEFGLRRFDGIQFVQPPGLPSLPGARVIRLLASRDGSLWIGTNQGLVRWTGDRLTTYPETANQRVARILEDHEGTVWVSTQGGPSARICAIRPSGVPCFGQDGSFGAVATALYEHAGGIWAAASTGLWRVNSDPPRRYAFPAAVPVDLSEENGKLLVATQNGLFQMAGDKFEPFPTLLPAKPVRASRLLKDRSGALWIGTTDRGVLRVQGGKTSQFGRGEGLSGDFVFDLFEDREGDVWVATTDGIDRFRPMTVSTVSIEQGVSADILSVIAGKDGGIWLATLTGLDRWNNGQVTVFGKRNGMPDDSVQALFQDDLGRVWASTRFGVGYFEAGRFHSAEGVPPGPVWSIAGGAGDLWVGSVQHGLLRLRDGTPIEKIPWDKLGRKDFASVLLCDPAGGGLWLGFVQGGIGYLKDGQLRSFTEQDGLSPARVNHLYIGSDGGLLVSTVGGLSRIKAGHVATLTSQNGLPCDSVHWAMEDDKHSLWLYTACGLVRIVRSEVEAWLANPKHTVQTTVLDASDGVRLHSVPPYGYGPPVAKDAKGALWFAAGGGVSVVDPLHLYINGLSPPVHVEKIVSDRQTRWENSSGAAASNLRLPALSRDLQIDYTALSLVAPEKVRFKYRLEGHDGDWQDAGNRRQAFYTNLPPRTYRFRVIASNNSGVWNETGDMLEFSIDPAYYQASWFRALIAAFVIAALWGIYRLRLYQIAREFNAQMEARVDERLRVARDLHDTLLQGFQGLMLLLQSVRDLLPARGDKALEEFDHVLEVGDQAIRESRAAIHGMRSPAGSTNDLAEAIRKAAVEFAGDASSEFRLVVEGAPRDVHPIVRDEAFRIACEAIRNAFRHANATIVEGEVIYDDSLRVRIRDDGKGMDPELAKGGRAGHYGLSGMRERALRIGGKLNIWSSPGAGTEIELVVHGSIAYGTSARTLPAV